MDNPKRISPVDLINLASIELMVSMMDKFSLLKEILKKSKNPDNDWDFFMTAAGTGLVLFSTENYRGEHEEVKKRATELNNELPRAIDDFINYMNKVHVSDDLIPGMVGSWVLMNLKKEKLTDEELGQLAGRIGFVLLKLVSDCKSR